MGFALLFIVNVMLHISSCWLDSVSRQIRYCTDEWMGCRTVITFVVIFNNPFPVRIQIHFPVMVKFIIPCIIEVLHPGLLVNLMKLVFPFYIWIAGLKIDPNEAGLVDVDVDGE